MWLGLFISISLCETVALNVFIWLDLFVRLDLCSIVSLVACNHPVCRYSFCRCTFRFYHSSSIDNVSRLFTFPFVKSPAPYTFTLLTDCCGVITFTLFLRVIYWRLPCNAIQRFCSQFLVWLLKFLWKASFCTQVCFNWIDFKFMTKKFRFIPNSSRTIWNILTWSDWNQT